MKVLFAALVVFLFLGGCIQTSLEQKMKYEIAKSEDPQLEPAEIKLINKHNYYIGYVQNMKNEYFICIHKEEKEATSFKIFRIFCESMENEKFNSQIVAASSDLEKINLKFDTIYDDGDSLNIRLLEKDTEANYGVYTIKVKDDVGYLEKYKLEKCHLKVCKEKL